MAGPNKLKHISDHVYGQDSINNFQKILSRDEPKGYRGFLETFNKLKENPNIDFRIKIYDPLIDKARLLVSTYGDDRDSILKEIQGQKYRDPVELLLIGGANANLPTGGGVVSAGKLVVPMGEIEALTPFVKRVGNNTEYRFYSKDRQVKHIFWRLVDHLTDTLSSGTYNFRLDELLRNEASKQMNWDESVQAIPKSELKKFYDEEFNTSDQKSYDVVDKQRTHTVQTSEQNEPHEVPKPSATPGEGDESEKADSTENKNEADQKEDAGLFTENTGRQQSVPEKTTPEQNQQQVSDDAGLFTENTGKQQSIPEKKAGDNNQQNDDADDGLFTENTGNEQSRRTNYNSEEYDTNQEDDQQPDPGADPYTL